MKKMILFVLAVIASVGNVQAQSSLVAVLNDGQGTRAFYGAEALKNAVSSIIEGTNPTVITLSSGTFNGVTSLKKGLTIRGAGMSVGDNGELPTIIAGGLTVNFDNIKIEGVYVNGTLTVSGYSNSNTQLLKCRFGEVEYTGVGNAYNNHFIHCIVANSFSTYKNSSVTLTNCVVNSLAGAGVFHVNHSVLLYPTDSEVSPADIAQSSVVNSIVYAPEGAEFPSTTTLLNNLGTTASLWSNSTSNSNATRADLTTIFTDYNGEYKDELTFRLTDNAALYLGTDNTQVGIYGGELPFDPQPTNPRIIKANVVGQSTADGKLPVELQVSGANN